MTLKEMYDIDPQLAIGKKFARGEQIVLVKSIRTESGLLAAKYYVRNLASNRWYSDIFVGEMKWFELVVEIEGLEI